MVGYRSGPRVSGTETVALCCWSGAVVDTRPGPGQGRARDTTPPGAGGGPQAPGGQRGRHGRAQPGRGREQMGREREKHASVPGGAGSRRADRHTVPHGITVTGTGNRRRAHTSSLGRREAASATDHGPLHSTILAATSPLACTASMRTSTNRDA